MIALNYRDARPIYEQIKEGIRKLILTGVITTGEKLPSVRELATELAINPNTIQRAYRELESEGFIYSVKGRGSFASELSHVDSARKEELLKSFQDSAEELVSLGTSLEELTCILERIAKRGAGK